MDKTDFRLRPLFSADQIAGQVEALADRVASAYEGKEIVLLPVLSGSLIFAADLVRRLPLDMVIRLCGLSSYPGAATRPRTVSWTLRPPGDLTGRHVLVVDDICDSGATLEMVCQAVAVQQPASLRSCVLLVRRGASVQPDFAGFHIDAGFVVGYGLDYDGRFRNLPQIAILEPVE